MSVCQQGLGLGIVPADDVAHHGQVRPGSQVFRGVAVLHRDAQALQKGAHGRVGVFVGAADPVALFFKNAGQGRHAGAADAEKMDVFRRNGIHFGAIWSLSVAAGFTGKIKIPLNPPLLKGDFKTPL